MESRLFTFYSYKGGVGRSLAVANVATLLAHWGKKVLIVDWVFEAPGLERYFLRYPSVLKGSRRDTDGVVDLIRGFANGTPLNWKDCLLTAYPSGEEKSAVSIISAGRIEEPFDREQSTGTGEANSDSDFNSYVKRLQSIDWKQLYDEEGLGSYLERLRSQWLQSFDFVLIDSRTGLTDIGAICAVHFPDVLVTFFTANEQSLDGCVDVVREARSRYQDLLEDVDRANSKLFVLPVPSRFNNATEHELGRVWKRKFAAAFQEIYSEWLPEDVGPFEAVERLFLPYRPYWSFGEGLPVLEEGSGDYTSLGYSLECLATLILNSLDWKQLGAPRNPLDAIEQNAELILSVFPESDHLMIKKLLCRFIWLSPDKKSLGSISIKKSALSADYEPVVDRLVTRGLLKRREPASDGEVRLEFANPNLQNGWARLRKQIHDDYSFLFWRQGLSSEAEQWVSEEKNNDILLRGTQLDLALRMSRDRRSDLSRNDCSFIDRSIRKRKDRQIVKAASIAGAIAVGIVTAYLMIWNEKIQNDALEDKLSAAKSRIALLESPATWDPIIRKSSDSAKVAQILLSPDLRFVNNQFVQRGNPTKLRDFGPSNSSESDAWIKSITANLKSRDSAKRVADSLEKLIPEGLGKKK